MPLLKFDLMEGRDQQAIQKLLDASHRAVVKALGVPERDRYQIVYQHPAHEFVVQDTGLGFERSDNRAGYGSLSWQRTFHSGVKNYNEVPARCSSLAHK